MSKPQKRRATLIPVDPKTAKSNIPQPCPKGTHRMPDGSCMGGETHGKTRELGKMTVKQLRVIAKDLKKEFGFGAFSKMRKSELIARIEMLESACSGGASNLTEGQKGYVKKVKKVEVDAKQREMDQVEQDEIDFDALGDSEDDLEKLTEYLDDPENRARFEGYLKPDLKIILSELELPVDGTKADLIDRLLEHEYDAGERLVLEDEGDEFMDSN